MMSPTASVNAVTLGTMVRLIAAIHHVPDDRLEALKGRFRNFLKVGFPNIPAVGTGSRAEYWPEQVAQVLVAFELVRFRVPQTAVAAGVAKHRDVVASAIGDAARSLIAETVDDAIAIWVASNSLLEDAKKLGSSDITLSRDESSSSDLGASSWRVDACRLVGRAVTAAQAIDEPLDAGFFSKLRPSVKKQSLVE